MRNFNKKIKQLLFTQSKGTCLICGTKLKKGWHADHIMPFSKGGETNINNGQATCPTCNIKKSNKIMKKEKELRVWQSNCLVEINKKVKSGEKTCLLSAGVGSGKTQAAISAYKDVFIPLGFKNVIVCAPSRNIKKSFAKSFLSNGIDLCDEYNFEYDYRDDFSGISTTYQALTTTSSVDFLIRNNIVNRNTLLILDEVHHLGNEKSWAIPVEKLGEVCGFVLMLTGTPYRSDNNKIPFCTYEERSDLTWELKVDFSYSYKKSLEDKVCCAVGFPRIGVDSYISSENEIQDNEEGKKLYNKVINTKSDIRRIMDLAEKKLSRIRESFMSEAACLVVCATIEQARMVSELIEDSVLVVSKSIDGDSDEDSEVLIDNFRTDHSKEIIVTVRMISEGVDIPRIRVIVYLSNITTPLYFQQVMGRGIRNRNDNKAQTIDTCSFFHFNYEPLNILSKNIGDEIGHIIEEQIDEVCEKKDRGERVFSEQEECDIDYRIGDVSLIYSGSDMTDVYRMLEEENVSERLKNMVLDLAAGKSTKEIPKTKSTTVLKEEICIEISRLCRAYVAKKYGYKSDNFGKEIARIHSKINSDNGFTNIKKANLSQLKNALEDAKRL